MVKHGGKMIVIDIWPFLSSMFDNSSEAAWPHKKGHPNGPLVVYFLWEGEENDKIWITQMANALDHIRRVALHEKCTTEGAAVYCNTTLWENTTVEDIYRANLGRLSKLRKQFDPKDVMGLTGGFRIPIVRPIVISFVCL
jgi:hypothetical protein